MFARRIARVGIVEFLKDVVQIAIDYRARRRVLARWVRARGSRAAFHP
jgi:hypothetical protein